MSREAHLREERTRLFPVRTGCVPGIKKNRRVNVGHVAMVIDMRLK